MNSQQELLDAINTITQSKDRSCDTPATVLRVEGDTVWVHIDGGADETPVQKTINCSEGETVQVRISNGNAFLVGNASAPPTDDTTANVAHFVAEQADIKAVKAEETATEVKATVEVLEVEVDEKVDIGTSNIQHLSSTMYQNANGVNVYNDTLAVGDSYAHIDGDSFDIKVCTTTGTIDDANDGMYASFGREVTVGTRATGSIVGQYSQVFGHECIASANGSHAEGLETISSGTYSHAEGSVSTSSGSYSHAEGSGSTSSGNSSHAEGSGTTASGDASHAEGLETVSSGVCSHAEGVRTVASGDFSLATGYGTRASYDFQTVIGKYNSIYYLSNEYALIIGNGDADIDRSDALRVKWDGNVLIDGNVQDMYGHNKTPTFLTSTTISASATSYTFTDNRITADSTVEVFDEIDGFEYNSCVASSGSCVITFDAQSTSHKIKLFVW